jgi:hypothetical protein
MRRLHSDVRVLVRFIRVYCDAHHKQASRRPMQLPTGALRALCPAPPALCAECRKLLLHAIVMRSRCPLNPKPACKHCPDHCYAPRYRQQIRKVMGYSGRKLVLSGRLDYLLHLWR